MPASIRHIPHIPKADLAWLILSHFRRNPHHSYSFDVITWVHNEREETGRKCYFVAARERSFPPGFSLTWHRIDGKTSDVRSRARLSQDWRLSSLLSSILYAPCQRTQTRSQFALSRKMLKMSLLRSIFTPAMQRALYF